MVLSDCWTPSDGGGSGARVTRVRATGDYPPDWPALSRAVKKQAGWRCARCDRPHWPAMGTVLTVAHLNHYRADRYWAVLAPLCARCHLWSHARIVLQQPRLFGEPEEWLRPYLAGWHARRVLGRELERAEVEARLVELIGLETACAEEETACRA